MLAILKASFARTALACAAMGAAVLLAAAAPTVAFGDDSHVPSATQSLIAQAESTEFASPDGFVFIEELSSGKPVYDSATKTLTLDNVVADELHVRKDGTLTIALTGESSMNVSNSDPEGGPDSNASIVVKGTGSLTGWVTISGDLTISDGILCVEDSSWMADGSLHCARLTVDGGTLDLCEAFGTTCRDLAMLAGKIDGDLSATRSIAVSGGVVTGSIWGRESTASYDSDYAATAVIEGGTVEGDVSGMPVTMKGGKVCGALESTGEVLISGGTAAGGVRTWSSSDGDIRTGGSLTVAGGAVTGAIDTGNLLVKGGKIALSGLDEGPVIACGKLVCAGGTISVKKCDGVGIQCSSLTLSKGSILVDDQYNGTGIEVNGGNLTMTGGRLKVTRSYEDAVQVCTLITGGETYRGKTTPVKKTGGKATIKGGSFTATTREPGEYDALSARKLSYKGACIKSVKGSMPKGFSFKVGGNTYKIVADNYKVYREDGGGIEPDYASLSFRHEGAHEGVVLTKFAAKGKKASFETVKYSGRYYSVVGVGPKAFSTKRGAKLTSIVFKNTLKSIGENAFSGTRSLTSLSIDLGAIETFKGGKLKRVAIDKDYTKVAKTAFRKCGKGNGAKLTVRLCPSTKIISAVGGSAVDAKRMVLCKALLKKHGLSKKASLVNWRR